MTLLEWSYIGSIITGIVAFAAVIIAWFQLSNLNKTLISNNLMTIFEIEFELNRRKERLSEIRNNNLEILQKFTNKTPTQTEKEYLKQIDGYRKEAYENYLNVFDRLCYFVLSKKLEEDDFRLEYRDMLFQTIEDDKEGTFNTGTKARNMKKLYDRWKEK